jgi:disulfide bond formation protein DsbB
LPFFIILFLSAIGVVFNFKKLINKLFFYVIILSLIANIFIAFYHSGVEKKIFKEFSGCNVKTNSVMVNIAQLREILQDSKIAKCDDPQLFIFGLTMAQWNFIYCLFLLIIVIYCYFRLIIKNNNNFN